MDTKKIEPLMTDARINVLSSSVAAARCALGTDLYAESNSAWRLGATHARDLYELDKAKTRAVVQELVSLAAELRCKEGCRKYEPGGTPQLCSQCGRRHRLLALAKSELNITPKP